MPHIAPSPTCVSDMHLQPRSKEGESPATGATRHPPSSPSITVLHHVPGRYIVVNKPPDVRIDGEFAHTVCKLVVAYLEGVTEGGGVEAGTPRFIQRLDYATSGVLLMGLCRRAAAVAARQFERREVRKEYVALLHGWTAWDERVFSQNIADTVPRGFRMTVGSEGNPGRRSETRCSVLERGWYYGAKVSKVRLEARSGRRHQLRVHCAVAAVPIVGDATYVEGEGERYFGDEGMVVERMMLHASVLEVGLAEGEGWREVVRRVLDAGDPFVPGLLAGLEFGGNGIG